VLLMILLGKKYGLKGKRVEEDDDDFVVEFTQMDKAINHVEK